ncbi:hypothetical protein D3C85_1594620 [compost metagenome]
MGYAAGKPQFTWICPARRLVKPAGIWSRQNASRLMRVRPSVMTTSLSGSVPKPISVGVLPEPEPKTVGKVSPLG